MNEVGSREVAVGAIRLAITDNRNAEQQIKAELARDHITAAAVSFGGDFTPSVTKIIERAVVAARREGVIGDSHAEEGAVAGAAHEAVTQLISKATGLNVGGKIGIARYGTHISVCVFFAIGLLNLNDVTIGLGHRAI